MRKSRKNLVVWIGATKAVQFFQPSKKLGIGNAAIEKRDSVPVGH